MLKYNIVEQCVHFEVARYEVYSKIHVAIVLNVTVHLNINSPVMLYVRYIPTYVNVSGKVNDAASATVQ